VEEDDCHGDKWWRLGSIQFNGRKKKTQRRSSLGHLDNGEAVAASRHDNNDAAHSGSPINVLTNSY
jgi:hypothetical protein